MKTRQTVCIDCGSEAVGTMVDDVQPLFRMTRIRFACGALQESSFTANGTEGRLMHWGCPADGETVGHQGGW